MADGMTPNHYGLGGDSLLAGLLLANGVIGNRREDCESETELARQIAEVNASIVQATQSQNLAAIQAVNAAAQAAQAVAVETRADVNRIEGAIELAGAQSEARMTSLIGGVDSSVERTAGDVRSTVERTAGDTRSRVESNAAEIRRDVADAQATLHGTVEDRTTEIRVTMGQNFATTLLEIERAKFETIKAKCDLERQAAENMTAIQLKAAENTASIQLEALKNKCDLSKQIAECCCELKGEIHEEGSKTRALIERNTIDALREKLEAAQREVEHHRHAESVRVSVQQYVNQNQRQTDRQAA